MSETSHCICNYGLTFMKMFFVQQKVLIDPKYQLKVIFLFAQVIAAEGEHKASSALKEAAHVIEDSPHALQVNMKMMLMLKYFITTMKNILNFNKCAKKVQMFEFCFTNQHHQSKTDSNTKQDENTSNITQLQFRTFHLKN